MKSIVEIYTEAVYENLKPLHANWEPGRPVELGDYGILRDRTFIQLGNLKKDLKIKFAGRKDSTKDNKSFASKGTTEVKFHSKGSVPVSGVVNAKASIEVAFSSEDAVFFNAADCEWSMIESKAVLGTAIMKLYQTRQWSREWAIVTDLIKSGATTLAISGASSSSIVFEATGKVDRIKLADASIGLTVAGSKNVGYQVVAQQGLVPLLGLCKIQSRFLWFGDKFKPLAFGAKDVRILNALENAREIQTEGGPEDLFFGQVK